MSDLLNFMHDNPIIQITISDAKPEIDRIFGPETQVICYLEEDECCQKSVEAMIQWDGDVEEGSAKLKQFDEEFWLSRAGKVAGLLMFDVRLVDCKRTASSQREMSSPKDEPRAGSRGKTEG